jgi:hypothetical protein
MVFATFSIGMVFANLHCSNFDAVVECEHTVAFVNRQQFYVTALHSTG